MGMGGGKYVGSYPPPFESTPDEGTPISLHHGSGSTPDKSTPSLDPRPTLI